MSTIYRFFTDHIGGSDTSITANTFVSKNGEAWFDPKSREIRFSDGVTPGGLPISLGNNALQTTSLTTTSLTTSTLNVSSISINGISSDNYTLDDISNATDGFNGTFALTFNQQPVSFNSPYNLEVFVNGLAQKPFNLYSDVVWQSLTLPANKGFTLDSGKIKFSSSIPSGSSVFIRTMFGSVKSSTNIYPFKALDIIMGY